MANQTHTENGSQLFPSKRLHFMTPTPTENKSRQIQVTHEALPLHCPMPDMVLWNAHPRVFLAIEKTGEALCPYCGTHYTLEGGAVTSAHG